MARVLADTTVHVQIDVQLGAGRLDFLYAKLTPELRQTAMLAAAREIERLVKVHVAPEAQHMGGFRVVMHDTFKCSHCGYVWTEKSHSYNGGCCAEDEKNAPAETEVTL